MPAPFDKEEIMRLWELGPIEQYFPLKFEDGAEWKFITGKCAKCKRPIPPRYMRGEVQQTFREIFHAKIVGYCSDCHLVTCYDWNIKKDSMTGKDENGNWRVWGVRKVGKFKQFWDKIFK
jgi:hypothetical protein